MFPPFFSKSARSRQLSANEKGTPRRRPRFPSVHIHVQGRRILDGTIKRRWRWRGIIIWQLPENIAFTALLVCFPQRFFQECTAPFRLDLARAFSWGKIKIHFLHCYTSSTPQMLALWHYRSLPDSGDRQEDMGTCRCWTGNHANIPTLPSAVF